MPNTRRVEAAVQRVVERMGSGAIRMENPRPHPVEGSTFGGVFRISGAQYKRISGQDFIQVTMLAQLTPERWEQMGRVAGRACQVSGTEVVDPVLREMFRDEVVAEVIGASPITGIQRTFDNLPPVTEGDDGIPPDETSGLVR